MFTVDGIEWNIPCDIERVANVKASEISGMLLDKSYFCDVIGTFLQYDVNIAANPRDMDAYVELFEILTQPVDGHSFVLPYNNSTVEITGRVVSINDVYVRMPNGGVYWKGTSFSIISNAPTKTMSLSDVLTRGRAPLPDIAEPEVGDSYTWDGEKWVESSEYDGE